MRITHIYHSHTYLLPIPPDNFRYMARVFVTYPRISTSQAAILSTIISIQAGSTLCQMKFTIAVISHVGKLKDMYLMRFLSFRTVSILILRYIFKTYVNV